MLCRSEEKEERRVRTSKIYEMRDLTKKYQLNNFSARKVLGSGAYGKVLLVTHEKENLNFALKCISKRPLVKHKHLDFIKVHFKLLRKKKRPLVSSV